MEVNRDQKVVVITGSTRGIGFALAGAFTSKGGRVVVSGRKQQDVDKAVAALNQKIGREEVIGIACDVQKAENLQALWDFAAGHFGKVDIWINNAGIPNERNPIADIPVKEIQQVVTTNLTGTILGTRTAMRGFRSQGFGAVYNMEGMGAKGGRKVEGYSIYGATKAGMRYFNDATAAENKDANIIVGALLPGMVLTDFVMGQYRDKPDEWEEVRGILTAIAGDVDDVAAWLVEKMLSNSKNGARFSYSNYLKILVRMARNRMQL